VGARGGEALRCSFPRILRKRRRSGCCGAHCRTRGTRKKDSLSPQTSRCTHHRSFRTRRIASRCQTLRRTPGTACCCGWEAAVTTFRNSSPPLRTGATHICSFYPAHVLSTIAHTITKVCATHMQCRWGLLTSGHLQRSAAQFCTMHKPGTMHVALPQQRRLVVATPLRPLYP
jgi:hypothetical protein